MADLHPPVSIDIPAPTMVKAASSYLRRISFSDKGLSIDTGTLAIRMQATVFQGAVELDMDNIRLKGILLTAIARPIARKKIKRMLEKYGMRVGRRKGNLLISRSGIWVRECVLGRNGLLFAVQARK